MHHHAMPSCIESIKSCVQFLIDGSCMTTFLGNHLGRSMTRNCRCRADSPLAGDAGYMIQMRKNMTNCFLYECESQIYSGHISYPIFGNDAHILEETSDILHLFFF